MNLQAFRLRGYANRYTNLVTMFAAGLAMAFSSSSATAQELLGYWRLEETDFFVENVIDASGNERNGYFDGNLEPGVEGAPGFGLGTYFDGTSGQIPIDDFEEVFGNLTNDFTVMAWIKPEQFDHKGRIFGSSPAGGGWGFGTVDDSLEITTYGVKDYDQPVPLELDTWAHVAVALDADNAANFYVNGQFVGTQTHSGPGNPTASGFFIGASCCATEFFQGTLDEVAVFRGTLNETQISNAANLAVLSYDAPPVNPDGLRFQLDFGTRTGAAEGWDIIDEIVAGDTCDYLGDAATPCTVFELTDQAGLDNDVTLEILQRPFIGNTTPSIDPYVFDGTVVPREAMGDYQYRDPDDAGSSAPFRFNNLDPGTYSVTVFEGRTTDGNGQFAKLWVGDANGSNEPGVPGEHEGQNTGDFAAGSSTLSLEVGEGEFLWYRHLEDNSGGISGLIIRSEGVVVPPPLCDPNTGGDIDGDGSVGFSDFLILSANFGTNATSHTEGDVNCDGMVGFPDFLILSSNFGTEVGGAQASSVPEPSGVALLGLAGLLGGVLRRRR